ncbi:AAA family ATPase [Spirosoma aerophilum]
MIFTTGGIKGGSGKTTLATNLAIHLSSKGRDVLFVDADDQGSAQAFTLQRESATNGKTGYTAIRQSDKEVRSEVMKLASKFDDVVIDTGGRDTTSQRAALSITDVYLVPFYPRSLDVWTLEKVEGLVSDMQIINPKLRAFSFISRADPKGGDNRDVAELLKESEVVTYLDTLLGMRKTYANAISLGLSIFEIRPKDPKAIEEFAALYNAIFTALKIKAY